MTQPLTLTANDWYRHIEPLVARVRRDLTADFTSIRDAGLPDSVYGAVGITIEVASDFLRVIEQATDGVADNLPITIDHAGGIEIVRTYLPRLTPAFPLTTREDLIQHASDRWQTPAPDISPETLAEILGQENARREGYRALTAPVVAAVVAGMRADGIVVRGTTIISR